MRPGGDAVDPSRRRTVRLAAALTAALLLAGALVYTSFSASNATASPSQLLRGATSGRAYQLSGTVLEGSVRRRGGTLEFRVRDRAGGASVPVSYIGAVPEPFRAGREVIVTVRPRGRGFVGEPDSLITRCPSKFTASRPA
jgi:cytochrome c-type biogenesis protein CcmE